MGFSIWIYVFGFSRCNGLIIYPGKIVKFVAEFNLIFYFSTFTGSASVNIIGKIRTKKSDIPIINKGMPVLPLGFQVNDLTPSTLGLLYKFPFKPIRKTQSSLVFILDYIINCLNKSWYLCICKEIWSIFFSLNIHFYSD